MALPAEDLLTGAPVSDSAAPVIASAAPAALATPIDLLGPPDWMSTDVPLPLCVQIETTTRCNLRCVMCPKGANGEVMGDLPPQVLDHVTGLIGEAWEVRPHGFGEVFLGPEVGHVLERCAQAGTRVAIVTNGTLLDDDRNRMIVDSGVEVLYVSIDAADPDLFRLLRKVKLEKILDGLRRLQTLKAERGVVLPRISLQMVGMSNNIHDLPAMVRLAASLRAEEVNVVAFTQFEMETIRTLGLRSLHSCPDEARRWFREARALAGELGVTLDVALPYRDLLHPPGGDHAAPTEASKGVANVAASPRSTTSASSYPPTVRNPWSRRLRTLARRGIAGDWGVLAEVARNELRMGARRGLAAVVARLPRPTESADHAPATHLPTPEPRPAATRRVRCQDPWNAVFVNYKGEVNPCCMSQRVMGRVDERPFEEIWNDQAYREFRHALLSAEPPPECRDCAKGGWYDPLQLEDWLEVGVNDQFGIQMGTGWGWGGDGVQWSRREATFRLRNTGKRRLRLALRTWPDRMQPVTQRGDVLVNEIPVGRFEFSSLEARPFSFDLPRLSTPEVLVRLRCEKEHRVQARENSGPVRIGVGLCAAALVS